MDTKKAWENMDRNTQEYVIALYQRYSRYESQKDLYELKEIFENHGCDDPEKRELERILRK